MTHEAAREVDRRCVLNWLYEVYVTPSSAFDEYTEDELRMFAHDAIILLLQKEQETIVRCKDCKYCEHPNSEKEWCKKGHLHRNAETWFCADGEKVVK